ncbi:hypothetical protein [Caulobacter endophyticus]|uniref:Phage regulatory protein CII (CP76) n=1 Tax=Caulobacter endophyticus TaxID=2172652 RepID=A0A2T9K3X5_9CAUL|nr:hypothetical protein [Caulobacter endophyticus]PVM90678.1 hypothetical protein DDF67_09620 [Caulobacter endophyticus]
MSRSLTPGELKAHVRQLVSAVGGLEAAAVILGVSVQRVSTLQNIRHDDQMTMLQICALEAVAGRDIVTGAASRAITGEGPASIVAAAVGAVAASAAALESVHLMDADGRRDPGEIRDVQKATRSLADSAAKLADAAAALTPGAAE